jgi:hypothetical protein
MFVDEQFYLRTKEVELITGGKKFQRSVASSLPFTRKHYNLCFD